jgi:DNA-binding NarL/FixJ family response regulator
LYVPQPQRVLIADDHATIRFLIRSLVEHAGFNVCAEAEDGARAIEEAKQSHPDLILLDVSMPGMNGIEAASQLKRLMPNVPIILFTLHDDSIGKQLAKAVGVDAIVAKSDGMSNLVDTMRKLVGLTEGQHARLA